VVEYLTNQMGCLIEFLGSFMISILSLLVARYYFHVPRSPVAHGIMASVIVFLVITLMFSIDNEGVMLNPASTMINGVQGRMATRSVVSYIACQLVGFLAGYIGAEVGFLLMSRN